MTDSEASYTAALAAMRMHAVMTGAAIPREGEPVDLVLMAAMARQSEGLTNQQETRHAERE